MLLLGAIPPKAVPFGVLSVGFPYRGNSVTGNQKSTLAIEKYCDVNSGKLPTFFAI
jgi:hypothetical protein